MKQWWEQKQEVWDEICWEIIGDNYGNGW
jgi:hypothetical protein